MDVQLADERILLLNPLIESAVAEDRAAARRADAFGAMARLSGLISRPRDDEFELIYRERRLQPFWRIACVGHCRYQRARQHHVVVPKEVQELRLAGSTFPAANGQVAIDTVELCRDEVRKEVFYDGLTRQPAPALAAYARFVAQEAGAERLARAADEGWVVLPSEAKASMLLREVLAGVLGRVDADAVLEEGIRVEALELIYRPVHAFRYRRAGKEAVVEVDGLTGEAKAGGATFEALLGKIVDPRFLLDVGVETAALFIPGARLAQIVISKGMEAGKTFGR